MSYWLAPASPVRHHLSVCQGRCARKNGHQRQQGHSWRGQKHARIQGGAKGALAPPPPHKILPPRGPRGPCPPPLQNPGSAYEKYMILEPDRPELERCVSYSYIS